MLSQSNGQTGLWTPEWEDEMGWRTADDKLESSEVLVFWIWRTAVHLATSESAQRFDEKSLDFC